jgi:hypothetical protein
VLNLRLTAGYVLLERHSFNLNLAMVDSRGRSKAQQQHSANLAYSYTYSYTFSVLADRKNKKWRLEAGF